MEDFYMTNSNPTTTPWGISGSTLKIIALITMLTDHIGAAILEPVLMQKAESMHILWTSYSDLILIDKTLGTAYIAMRYIGRIAFPIFCFLLVEGFLHTRNVRRYAFRLLLFALISEIPFDLAFHHQLSCMDYQNVFFTLFIGLLVITALQAVMTHMTEHISLRILLCLISIFSGMYFASLLNTDYGAMGVLTILLIYVVRNNRLHASTAACLCLIAMNTIEATSLLCIPLITHYNGKRGLQLKYVFYTFYPVHLLILYCIYQLLF